MLIVSWHVFEHYAGNAISHLAGTYCALGRLADAVSLQESVLEQRRRTLPENHLAIGEGHVWSDALDALS